MKKLFLFFLILAGLFYVYYWYVLGINLLLSAPDPTTLPPYGTFAVRIQGEGTSGEGGGTWESAARLPTARVGVAAAVIGDEIFVIGGRDALAQPTDRVDVFDKNERSWSQVVSLPDPRFGSGAVAIGKKIFVIGGFSGMAGQPTDTLFIYDYSLNSWSVGSPVPIPLGAAAVTEHGGRIHVMGGQGEAGSLASHYVYDPAKAFWFEREPLLMSRDHAGAVSIGDQIFLIGGRQGSLLYNERTLEIYDVKDKTWDRFEPMRRKRSDLGVSVLDGKLYVFGGEAATVTYDDVESYDPASGKWETVARMPEARHGFATAVVEGQFFLIGGGRRPGLSVSDLNEVFIP